MSPSVVQAKDLAIQYRTRDHVNQALDSASIDVLDGEIVAVVGESGSGKTTLGLAALGLLPATAQRTDGDILLDGQSLFDMDSVTLRRVRREKLGLVLQDATASLDPTKRIDYQIAENLHGERKGRVRELLELVRMPDIDRVLRSYPHQLSGGMAQRVSIAVALAGEPRLIIADEPTAALDAEIKHEILVLLARVSREARSALMILTHDIVSVAPICNRIAVMYGGRVVEFGITRRVLSSPRHPYTRGLLNAVPGFESPGALLPSVPGAPVTLAGPAVGCSFVARCGFAVARCAVERPEDAGESPVLCLRRDDVARIPFVTPMIGLGW